MDFAFVIVAVVIVASSVDLPLSNITSFSIDLTMVVAKFAPQLAVAVASSPSKQAVFISSSPKDSLENNVVSTIRCCFLCFFFTFWKLFLNSDNGSLLSLP